MPVGRAAANLIITDKRSDGMPATFGWGLDFRLDNLDSAIKVAGPFQNSAREQPEWLLDGVSPLHQLNAVILRSIAGSASMVIGNWVDSSGEEPPFYWKLVSPPGWQREWIKWYDGRPDVVGSARSFARYPTDFSWCLRLLRTMPPAAQTLPCYLAITLNCVGTIQYRLALQHGDTSYDYYYPCLEKSIDGGATFELVDALARDEAGRWAAAPYGQVQFVYWRQIPDHLIINLGELSPPWIYYEEGLEIPEGHVRIEHGGGQIAWFFHQAEYAPTGTIERAIYTRVPDFINPVADSMSSLKDLSNGTGVLVEMLSDSEGARPKATLSSNSLSHDYTPVLYEIQATRPGTRVAPVTTVLFDNEDGDVGHLQELEYTIARGWQGSSCRAKLRDMGGYDLTGNEKVTVKVALDTGGALSFVTQMTGYLEIPDRTVDPKELEPGLIAVCGRDRCVRFDTKFAWMAPSFAGWTFADALYWLLTERGGVLPADVLLDAGASDFTFPCPMSELPLKFDHTTKLVYALNELCRAANRTWGVDQNGAVFTVANGTTGYSGTPDYVLDDSSVAEEDHLYWAQSNRDIFSIRNHVLVIGSDRDGNDSTASWRCTNSMTDPSSQSFLGEDAWDVRTAPDGGDPNVLAGFIGTSQLYAGRLLKWQTNGKPTLFPDHYVQVNIDGIDIPSGSVFVILEKWGRLNSRGEFISEFLGELVS